MNFKKIWREEGKRPRINTFNNREDLRSLISGDGCALAEVSTLVPFHLTAALNKVHVCIESFNLLTDHLHF